MESIVKPSLSISPVINALLGESSSPDLRTIDIHLDSAPTQNRINQHDSNVRKLNQGIEDTKSEWASLRSSLRPATGAWIQPKEQILDSLTQKAHSTIELTEDTVIGPLPQEHDESNDLLDLLNEATSYLKEELSAIKGELLNIHLYKDAIQSLSENFAVGENEFTNLSQKLDDSAWVVGQKLDNFEGQFERFTSEDLPEIQQGNSEIIIRAIREFEKKCLTLGAAQLDYISRIEGLEGRPQIEELQESLVCLIHGQKKIFESIADILKSLKKVSLNVSNLPGQETLEHIATKQEDKIDSINLQMVEAMIEDRGEDRILRRAVVGLGFICLMTFGAIVYNIMG